MLEVPQRLARATSQRLVLCISSGAHSWNAAVEVERTEHLIDIYAACEIDEGNTRPDDVNWVNVYRLPMQRLFFNINEEALDMTGLARPKCCGRVTPVGKQLCGNNNLPLHFHD